ncbi:MAG: hypothetical protein BMS9Abin32_159 [Gammaproteobacteria bacterium]|nr:MAG: hypothetical protein BMS9Abin32_159 [Gammaproteobacteria bacterium]
MDEELQVLLEAAEARALNEFRTRYMSGVYSELMQTRTDARGFIKLFATAEGSVFERFKGAFSASSIEERGLTIIADRFGLSKNIPMQKWDQLIAWLGNSFPGLMADAGMKGAFKIDLLANDLLARAVAGTIAAPTNLPNLYDDAVALGNVEAPGSGAHGPVIRNTNRIDGGTYTEANLRAAYYTVLEALAEFKSPDGSPYFNPMELVGGLRIMQPVLGKVQRILDLVFATGRTVGDTTRPRIVGVEMRPNSLWNQDSRLKAKGLFFYLPTVSNLTWFQFVQTITGMTFADDLPDNEAGLRKQSAEQQKTQRYTLTATKDMEVGIGSPIQGIWVDFTGMEGK